MSEQDTVLLNIKDNIATITLNKPDVHNAFDEHVIQYISNTLDKLYNTDNLVACVLQSTGNSFSAGADLGWMKRAADFTKDKNRQDALALAHMLKKLDELPVVTIACVQGAAMGGGLGLVSCCDIVIAQEKAFFALSEVKLGLIPATIAPYVLRAIGQRQARRYFQTGERFNSMKASQIGLVHEIANDEKHMSEILNQIIEQIQSNGPQSMRSAKQLCLDLEGKTVTDEVMNDTAQRIADARATDEAKQRLDNFLNRKTSR